MERRKRRIEVQRRRLKAEAVPADLAFSIYMIGKDVVLLGGAELEERELADLYSRDDNSIIVATNNHRPDVPAEVVFSRVALKPREVSPLFVFADWEEQLVEQAKTVFGDDSRYVPISAQIYHGPAAGGPQLEWCNKLATKLGTMPLTGIIALTEILSQQVKSVTVLGFTFFGKNVAAPGEPAEWELPERVNSHAIPAQVNYFHELYRSDDRIRASKRTFEVITRGFFGSDWITKN